MVLCRRRVQSRSWSCVDRGIHGALNLAVALGLRPRGPTRLGCFGALADATHRANSSKRMSPPRFLSRCKAQLSKRVQWNAKMNCNNLRACQDYRKVTWDSPPWHGRSTSDYAVCRRCSSKRAAGRAELLAELMPSRERPFRNSLMVSRRSRSASIPSKTWAYASRHVAKSELTEARRMLACGALSLPHSTPC